MINNVKNEPILKYHVQINAFDSNDSFRTEAIVNIFWHSKRNKYYFWYQNGDGKQRHLSCHTTDRKEAKRYAISKMQEILTEDAVKKGAVGNVTLSEFRNMYLDHVQNQLKESTLRTIRTSFNQFLTFLGDMPVGAIRHADCYRFIYQNTRSVHWSRTMYGHLKAAFGFGVRMEWCEKNPLEKVPKPKLITDEEAKWISPSDFKLLESQMPVDSFKKRTLKRLCVLAFETGARMGELRSLSTKDVQLSADSRTGTMDIVCSHRHRTKSDRRRLIPLSLKAIATIVEQEQDSLSHSVAKDERENFLFRNAGKAGMMPESTISHYFKGIVRTVFPERVGIHFHSLRHSFCTNLMRNGTPPLQVQQIAGHSDLRTTMQYTHLQNMDFAAALSVMNSLNQRPPA